MEQNWPTKGKAAHLDDRVPPKADTDGAPRHAFVKLPRFTSQSELIKKSLAANIRGKAARSECKRPAVWQREGRAGVFCFSGGGFVGVVVSLFFWGCGKER